MDSEILYKSIGLTEYTRTVLDYYIIPESISEAYCDLKCYGIKIQKTVTCAGGGKTIESKQINNVFYRYSDVDEFLGYITSKCVEPRNLRDTVEKYIIESIDRARKSA